MNSTRFDRISKLVAQRRRFRSAVAQEASPAPANESGGTPELLFVQTFRAGAIAPYEGAEGRYTLTLEGGYGQTVYLSDRPDRLVGATPTGEFLGRLGFLDDNPPNAALVVETAPGESDVAVLELFSPIYDEATGGITYEVEVLGNWEAELGVGLSKAPTDLAAIEPAFGTAHLFIDGALDCPNGTITCTNGGKAVGTIPGYWFDNFCSHELVGPDSRSRAYCVPCRTPADVLAGPPPAWKANVQNVWSFWGNVCNERIPECNGNCRPAGWCEPDPYWQNACPSYS